MQKCSLCGGRVINGRCEDCGLPIPPENHIVLRGETAHTHTVNGEEVLHRVRKAPGKTDYPVDEGEPTNYERENAAQNPQQPRATVRTARYAAGGRQRKRRGKTTFAVAWIFILVFLLQLLPMLFRYIERVRYDNFWEDTNYNEPASVPMPETEATSYAGNGNAEIYKPLCAELADLPGSHWEQALTPGEYRVGTDIPAGLYTVQPPESGFVYIYHVDRGNDIDVFDTLYGDETEETDLPLADGARLWIFGENGLSLSTENAQLDTLQEPAENPATETITLSTEADNIVKYSVGTDIPAGVYDIWLADGEGFLDFYGADASVGCAVYEDENNVLVHMVLEPGDVLDMQNYSSSNSFAVDLVPTGQRIQ